MAMALLPNKGLGAVKMSGDDAMQSQNSISPVYMDYNASAPLREKALDAMIEALHGFGNASSIHRFGRERRALIEGAREKVAKLVGAEKANVVFTSGGTEANNLALANREGRALFVSAIEHPSILAPAERSGATFIPVNREGIVDLDVLRNGLRSLSRPAMVSVMAANNETGAIQPVRELARLCHEAEALFHCDATQMIGRLPFHLMEDEIDLLTLSSHKIGGPQGMGALVARRDDMILEPQILGGGQERSRRSGTENVAAIVGFGVAAYEAAKEIAEGSSQKTIAALRDRLESGLEKILGVHLFSKNAPRLFNTSAFALEGASASILVAALDLAGFAISAGSACSSGKVRPSHVIKAMGYEPSLSAAAIRVSLGTRNTKEEIDGFLAAFASLAKKRGANLDAA